MPSKAQKLLVRMRQSGAGWKSKDIITLYSGFGFIISQGGSHYTVKHPEFPHIPALRDTLPRSDDELSKAYVRDAIKRIELLEKLRKEAEEKDE
jgi:predicted RNA binding protein YcfA (HicA-like mRNA interferase family)